jgi:adenine-specific DNA-methyltransferase
MPPKNKVVGATSIEALKHPDKRINIPTADAHDFVSEEAAAIGRLTYPRDPALDPQLVWTGKDRQDLESLTVDAPPIYVQDKIVPRAIIKQLAKATAARRQQPMLFDDEFADFDGLKEWESVEYYQHQANWSNRMVLGDSLQVMGSLIEKENLRGKVQMIFFDPPYGIRFGSNWQVSTRNRDVKDGNPGDATREVEQIKAFRDTWQGGINSYLAYLRDRLVVARDLLTEKGSIFVQIGDENVHRVRCVLDEVFGDQNFVSLITYSKTGGATADLLPNTSDFIIWYAKDRASAKFRKLYQTKMLGGTGADKYDQVEMPDGRRLPLSRAPQGQGRPLRLDNLTSPRVREARTGYYPVDIGGREYLPRTGEWKTNREGMARLVLAGRVQATGNSLSYVRYLDDFPAYPLGNNWTDIGGVQSRSDPKIYVVQTSTTAIQRCMLMTTDPGDLVLDPTCGSGTTALVAEQWARRWIVVDTSRVAIALARQRMLGAKLPAYLLVDSVEGRTKVEELTGQVQPRADIANDPSKGLVCERVAHVTLRSIANNPDIEPGMTRQEIQTAILRHAETELLHDRPLEDRRKVRVVGPFTVESLSPHRSPSFALDDQSQDGGEAFLRTVLDNLATAGVQNGWRNERLEFASLSPYAGRYIQAEGDRRDADNGTPRRVAISIGPQYGTVSADWIKQSAREALKGVGFDVLVVCGFAFDARAGATAEEFKPVGDDFAAVQEERRIGKLPILLVRMNADLAMGDALLKKTGRANLFTVFGEPDVEIEALSDSLIVKIRGVDVYNPTTLERRSGGTADIAMWMVDTEYTEESFFARHCYFAGKDGKPEGFDPYTSLRKSLRADIDEAAWSSLFSTVSLPFPKPESGKIAVKVINHYGDEVLKVYDV